MEAATVEKLKEGENPHIDMPDAPLFINPGKVIAVRESLLSTEYCTLFFESKDFSKPLGDSVIVKGTVEEVIEKLSE